MARDLGAIRRRRRQAVRLFGKGESQAEVARQLGVSRQTAMVWWNTLEQEGAEGLAEPGAAGRPCRVAETDLRAIEKALLTGPRAQGYETDLWTLPRIATVIARITGVDYHPGHVWRLMRKLGWSLQKPTTRARERDERVIRGWVRQTWPQVRKTPRADDPRSAAPGRGRGKPRA